MIIYVLKQRYSSLYWDETKKCWTTHYENATEYTEMPNPEKLPVEPNSSWVMVAEDDSRLYIVAEGDIVSGFKHHGPFNDCEAAMNYANKLNDPLSCIVIALEQPNLEYFN